jgi:phosphate-selective porin OprO and OprP
MARCGDLAGHAARAAPVPSWYAVVSERPIHRFQRAGTAARPVAWAVACVAATIVLAGSAVAGETIAGLRTEAFEPIRLLTARQPAAESLAQGDAELTADPLDPRGGPPPPESVELPEEGEAEAAETEAEELARGESQLGDDALAVGADVSLKAEWNNGLEFFSTNREFRVHVGGRAQVDTTAFTAGPGPSLEPVDGGLNPRLSGATNFRRARFRIDGQMYENYEWITEFDFVNQLQITSLADPTAENAYAPSPAPTEVWLAITKLPLLGNVVIGNQNTLTGLEHITSDRFVNFMERSFLADAFTMPFNNAYAPGIVVFQNYGDNDEARLAVGVFKDDFNIFGFANTAAANSIQMRATRLVVDEPEENRWTHLGLCAVYQQTPKPQISGTPGEAGFQEGSIRYRVRGNIRNGPPGPLNSIYLDSGLLGAAYQTLLTAEYASNWGPLQVQAEWTCTLVPKARSILNPSKNAGQQPFDTVVDNLFYQGAYCEVMYALTGEGRAYNRRQAVLDRFIPRNNFFRVGTARGIAQSEGAWQIGARYDWVCLNDKGINGGVLNGVTLGLNWFLNPNTRMAFNYDFTYRDFTNSLGGNGSGGINSFGSRLFFDF